MGCEELSLSGFIKEMKDVSEGPHPRKFCFVLGAGASKSSGIKSGQDLVNIWDAELLERNRASHIAWKESLGITEENKYGFYSQYYERRFARQPRDGYNYLEKLMEHAKPSAGYVMLAYLLSHTTHNVVVTTNFDHLIEDAVNYYSQTIPLVIGHEVLAHYITNPITRPTIIKIHRDLLLDPKSKLSELEQLHENWTKALSVVFSNYHPIFIGYAGNDHSLMDFLIKNSGRFVSGEWCFPYWMLYGSDPLDGLVQQFVNGSNGYHIRHGGFDETLYRMGAVFDYRIPQQDKFLNDARKRYQALSNSIDEFTRKSSEDMASAESSAAGETELNQAIQQITAQTDLQRMYRDAVRLHNAKKYEQALELERRLIALNGDSAEYRSSIGITLHEMKRYDEALEEKQRAVESEPDSARYHNSLGITLHEMRRYDDALTEKQRAVKLEPDNARYHDSLSTTFHEMKRYEEALDESKKAVELEPDNAKYHDSLGVTFHEMKRYGEALIESKKAVELDSDNARYCNNLGITLHDIRRYEEALIAKQKAVELEPDNARYHNSIGITLRKMERYDEALTESQKAVELEPDNARYHNSVGITLCAMKRYEDALTEFQKAVELEPDNAQYQKDLEHIKSLLQ